MGMQPMKGRLFSGHGSAEIQDKLTRDKQRPPHTIEYNCSGRRPVATTARLPYLNDDKLLVRVTSEATFPDTTTKGKISGIDVKLRLHWQILVRILFYAYGSQPGGIPL